MRYSRGMERLASYRDTILYIYAVISRTYVREYRMSWWDSRMKWLRQRIERWNPNRVRSALRGGNGGIATAGTGTRCQWPSQWREWRHYADGKTGPKTLRSGKRKRRITGKRTIQAASSCVYLYWEKSWQCSSDRSIICFSAQTESFQHLVRPSIRSTGS